MAHFNHWLLGTCFFLSGATSLALEVAWAKELSYILGNTIYAVSTVVAAFMGGLGLGSGLASKYAQRVKNPILAYARMEWIIGVCAMVSIPLFRSTEGIFRMLYSVLEPGHGTFLLVRFLVVFVLMLIPVTLMGMTLPVVVGAYGRRKEGYALEVGVIYGVNTLGAVGGTLLGGFLLVPWLGLWKTCVVVGAADAIIGVVLWCLQRRVGAIEDIRIEKESSEQPKTKWTPAQVLIGGIFLVSGAVAMVYEVGWFRLLSLVLGPSVHAFSVMLAVFLIGIGLGSVMAARWAQTTRRPWMAMAGLEGLIGVTALGTMAFYNELPVWYFRLFRGLAEGEAIGMHLMAQALVAGAVVLLPTLGMGALFPVVVRVFREAGEERMKPESSVGGLYLLNTIGGIIGSLLGGFWLVPGIGMWKSVMVASGVSVGLGVIVWMGVKEVKWLPKAVLLGVAALVVGGGIAALPRENVKELNQGWYYSRPEDLEDGFRQLQVAQLLFYREGVNAAISVVRAGKTISLRTQGKPDASNIRTDLYNQFLVGHLPALFAPEGARAAFIGYGSGMGAGVMMAHPHIASLDILEIEQGVMDASPYFEFLNRGVLRDPRVEVIVEDGRTHLTYTPKRYDVIVSIPSNPSTAGVSNLFTADFYEIVRKRLTEKGVFLGWMQLYHVSEESFRVVAASIAEVFPHVAMFHSSHNILFLASKNPIELSWETFLERSRVAAVKEELEYLDFRAPEEVLAHFIAFEDTLRESVKDVMQRSTDDNVWLEHRMVKELMMEKGKPVFRNVIFLTSPPESEIRRLIPGASLESLMPRLLRYVARRQTVPAETASWIHVWDLLIGQWRSEATKRGWTEFGEAFPENIRKATAVLAKAPKTLTFGNAHRWEPYITEAFELAPEVPVVRLGYGTWAIFHGDREVAKTVFGEMPVDRIYDAYHFAQLRLADMAQEEGKSKEALTYMRKALFINPCHSKTLDLMAEMLESYPDREAEEHLHEVVAMYHPERSDLRRRITSFSGRATPTH